MAARSWKQQYDSKPTLVNDPLGLRYVYKSPYATDGTDDYVGLEQDMIQCMFPCRVARGGALNATYSNGTAGVGATLTNAGTQAALAIDGVTLNVNDRVLVIDQAPASQNGIYVVSNVGSGATNWVLTRATDFNQAAQMRPGRIIPIILGGQFAATIWVVAEPQAAVVGTDPIDFFSMYELLVPLSGGTMTGTLTLNADGVSGLQAVTYQQLLDSTDKLTWQTITVVTTFNAAVNHGYVIDVNQNVDATLPATAAVGEICQFESIQSVFSILPSSSNNQRIYIGNQLSATGVGGGKIVANSFTCSVKLVCIVANTIWKAEAFDGNWTVTT